MCAVRVCVRVPELCVGCMHAKYTYVLRASAMSAIYLYGNIIKFIMCLLFFFSFFFFLFIDILFTLLFNNKV